MKISEIENNKLIYTGLAEKYLPDVNYKHLKIDKIEVPHSLDLKQLKQSIDTSLHEFGTHYWQTADGPNEAYYGFSINYNPDHQDNLDINSSSLGTPKNKSGQFFYQQTQNHQQLKNSYYDSYGFRKRTPAASKGYLSEILDSCQCSLIRGRMMILDGSVFTSDMINAYLEAPVGDSKFGWHRDEPVHVNLRINIPVFGDDNFVFEMENQAPYVLQMGKLYSWDTNIAHRVYCKKLTQFKRYNLIIGVSPWFDYDPVNDAWNPNQYCGRVSPFDMLKNGVIFPWLKV